MTLYVTTRDNGQKATSKYWTTEMVETLRYWAEQGESSSQIGARLKVSRHAVISKCHSVKPPVKLVRQAHGGVPVGFVMPKCDPPMPAPAIREPPPPPVVLPPVEAIPRARRCAAIVGEPTGIGVDRETPTCGFPVVGKTSYCAEHGKLYLYRRAA